MKQAAEETQRAIRRRAEEALIIYDLHTNQPIGQVLDMSANGMKLMSEEPIEVFHVYYCRLPLPKKLNGRQEVFFDAECRWCLKNEETQWYNSGYRLRFPSNDDAKAVRAIIRRWMVEQMERANNPEKDEEKNKKCGLLARLFK